MKKLLLLVIALMTSISVVSQVKLHPDLTADASIEYFEISPDGSTLVYVADRDTDDVFELYSVPLTGGTNTKLSGTMVDGGDIQFSTLRRFQFSPDGQTVVYLADQDIDGTPELYAVPTSGGSVTKLNGTLVGSDGVRSFNISPDGQYVVYVADELDNFDDELYSVPITGGTSTKISQPDIGIGDVETTFHISPDSQWVVFVVDAESSSVLELFSVPITGGTINKLNGTLVSGGDVESGKVFVSSDSQYVVYTADQDTNFIQELYSTPIGGGTNTKLNSPLPTTNDDVERVFLSSDSQWVVYVAGNFANQDYEIYSVPIAGGTVNNLSPAEIDNDFDGSLRNSVSIGTESDVVYYTVNTNNFSSVIPEAFGVLIDGSETPVNISGLSDNDENSSSTSTIGVTRKRVVEQADGTCVMIMEVDAGPAGIKEMWRRPIFKNTSRSTESITLGEMTRLNPDFVSGGQASDFITSSNDQNVIYRADQETDNTFELFTVPVNGEGIVVKINGELTPNGDVVLERSTSNGSTFQGVQSSSDGLRIVYMADQDTDGIFELYSADYTTILSTDAIVNDDNIQLFNDSQGTIHIKGIDQGRTTVEVYSILGSRVFEASFEANGDNTIPTNNIQPGFYIVRVSSDNGQFKSKKMIFR